MGTPWSVILFKSRNGKRSTAFLRSSLNVPPPGIRESRSVVVWRGDLHAEWCAKVQYLHGELNMLSVTHFCSTLTIITECCAWNIWMTGERRWRKTLYIMRYSHYRRGSKPVWFYGLFVIQTVLCETQVLDPGSIYFESSDFCDSPKSLHMWQLHLKCLWIRIAFTFIIFHT